MGFDRVTKAFEKGALEIAPLAFMRGRTLNHAFVILDEAQNTTTEQMKMFLTRIGFGSKCVVNGDISQIDLPRGATSGLVEAQRVLAQVRGIAMTRFTAADVVRHPLVARIVEAYEADKRHEQAARDGDIAAQAAAQPLKPVALAPQTTLPPEPDAGKRAAKKTAAKRVTAKHAAVKQPAAKKSSTTRRRGG
jgi:phosphate starvation-inducible PhoH-like protein